MLSQIDGKNRFSNDDLYPLNPYPDLIINAAVTGMVSCKKDTPFIPITVDEIIEDSIGCVDAGASILHLHARDNNEKPTYRSDAYAKIIEGIRNECRDIIICVSTSGRAFNEFEKRSEVLELDGFVKPDMASLTLGSLNFPKQASINDPEMIFKLAGKMKEKNIMPELEIFDTGMVNTAKYLCRKRLINPPFYFNIILGSIYSAQARMSDVVNLVNSLPQDSIWSLGGIGVFQLIMNSTAIIMGGNVRVGLEDNIWYDNKKIILATNRKNILRIRRMADEVGRKISTPKKTREMLCLNAPNEVGEKIGPLKNFREKNELNLSANHPSKHCI